MRLNWLLLYKLYIMLQNPPWDHYQSITRFTSSWWHNHVCMLMTSISQIDILSSKTNKYISVLSIQVKMFHLIPLSVTCIYFYLHRSGILRSKMHSLEKQNGLRYQINSSLKTENLLKVYSPSGCVGNNFFKSCRFAVESNTVLLPH